jgi:hypothetical protein
MCSIAARVTWVRRVLTYYAGHRVISEHLSLESSMKSWKENGLLEYVQETFIYIDGAFLQLSHVPAVKRS